MQLWEAVALSLNIEPTFLKEPRYTFSATCDSLMSEFDENEDFLGRLQVSESHAKAGQLQNSITDNFDHPSSIERLDQSAHITPFRPALWEVSLPQYAAWAISIRWPIPDELAEVAGAAPVSQWPWGDYTTKRLDLIAAAVNEFWAHRVDADLPPRNEDVEQWLIENHGVAQTTAKAIATIIRADGLPTGRRADAKDSNDD